MSNKIDNLTPEQWAEIAEIVPRYLRDTYKEIPDEDMASAVTKLYSLVNKDLPPIIYVDSPMAGSIVTLYLNSMPDEKAAKIAATVNTKKEDKKLLKYRTLRLEDHDTIKTMLKEVGGKSSTALSDALFFYFRRSHAAFYEGGKIAGVQFNEEDYNTYLQIVNNLSVIYPYEEACIVCRNPIFVGWDDQNRVSATDRPAIEWADGFKIWAIEGHLADEQLIMHPETQTLEQIQKEENEEVRRIRINRYGWSKFIQDVGGEVRDVQSIRNGTEGKVWMESLMHARNENMDYTVLLTYDPSTGRPYALEVPPDTMTCEQAQRYLLAPEDALAGLDIKCEATYPAVRT